MASNKNTGQEFADLQSKAQQVLSNRSNELENQMIVHKESQDDAVDLQGALQMTVDPNSGQAVPTSGPQEVPASQAGLRPETQAILSRYGVNASVSERSSRSSSNNTTKNSTTNTSTQSTGSTKVTNTTTVNNVTNNNNTTTTNVKSEAQPQKVVVQSAAPTAVRANSQEVAAKQQVLLNNFFRKKSTADAQRDREYRKKDRELKREQNSLFDKLKDFTSRTINSLDPNNNSTQKGTMNFFKWIIGSYLVGKYLHPTLRALDSVVTYFTGAKGSDGKRAGIKESKFVQDLTGIKDGLVESFNNIKNEFMESRKAAFDALGPMPDFSGWSPIDSMKGIMEWLAKALVAGLGGSSALAKLGEFSSKSTEKKVSESTPHLSNAKGDYNKWLASKSLNEAEKVESVLTGSDGVTRKITAGFTEDGSESVDTEGKVKDLITYTKVANLRYNNGDLGAATVSAKKVQEENKDKFVTVNADYLRNMGIDPQKLVDDKLAYYGIKGLKDLEAKLKELEDKKRSTPGRNRQLDIEIESLKSRIKNVRDSLLLIPDAIGKILASGDKYLVDGRKEASLSREGETDMDLLQKVMNNSPVDYNGGRITNDVKSSNVDFYKSIKSSSGYIDADNRYQIEKAKRAEERGGGFFKPFGDAFSRTRPVQIVSSMYHSAKDALEKVNIKENAKKITDALMGRLGFTKEQASGAAGVLMAESGLNPAAENKEEKKSGRLGPTGHGQGIAQWSLSRNQDFYDWYEKKYGKGTGKYPSQASLDDQIEFMIHEMMGRPAFMEAMRNAQDPAQAADVMLRGFENGGKDALATPRQLDSYSKVGSGNYDHLITTRASYAHGIHDALFGKETPVEAKAEGGEVTQDTSGSPGIPFSSVSANDVSYSSEPGFNVPAITTPTVTSVSPSEVAKNFKPMVSEADSNKVDLDTLTEIKGLRKDLRTVGAAIVQASSSPIILNQGGTTVNNNITPSSGVDKSNIL